MNILFLVGNGFDLNLGMKTSYRDFIKYYVEKKSMNDSTSVHNFKKEIEQDLDNWSDLELALGEYTSKLNTRPAFDGVFNDIRKHLSEYLQAEEEKLILKVVDVAKFHRYIAYPEESLSERGKSQIKSFRNTFGNVSRTINIISYNYTRTIERILKYENKAIILKTNRRKVDELKSIQHIHGYTKKQMVLGVNDISQISNTSFRDNADVVESLVKSSCNQAIGHNIDTVTTNNIKTANIICLFGLSLGDTDKMWWELIGNQLKRDCRVIIFIKADEVEPLNAHMIGRHRRKWEKRFFDKTKFTEEERKSVDKKIYIGVNTDMFKL